MAATATASTVTRTMPEAKSPLAAFSAPIGPDHRGPAQVAGGEDDADGRAPDLRAERRILRGHGGGDGEEARRKNPTPGATATKNPSEPRWPRSQSPGAAATPAAMRNGFRRRIRSLARPSTTDPTSVPAPPAPPGRSLRPERLGDSAIEASLELLACSLTSGLTPADPHG
jgi:hypothetical protein